MNIYHLYFTQISNRRGGGKIDRRFADFCLAEIWISDDTSSWIGGACADVLQNDAVTIHIQISHRSRDRERVMNVGFAAHARLPFVSFFSQQVGAMNVVDLFAFQALDGLRFAFPKATAAAEAATPGLSALHSAVSERPRTADCGVCANLLHGVATLAESPIRSAIRQQPRLISYIERVVEQAGLPLAAGRITNGAIK